MLSPLLFSVSLEVAGRAIRPHPCQWFCYMFFKKFSGLHFQQPRNPSSSLICSEIFARIRLCQRRYKFHLCILSVRDQVRWNAERACGEDVLSSTSPFLNQHQQRSRSNKYAANQALCRKLLMQEHKCQHQSDDHAQFVYWHDL